MLVFALVICVVHSFSQTPPAPLPPLPSPEQMRWHEMEMNAFIHFGINTFTDKEWGYGDESPELFDPATCDPAQWVRVLKKAGFGMVILTAKHHDGFCLWPSRYTSHNISASRYRNGKGNIVGELRDACRRYAMPFGIYLSPWDRNHAGYGTASYIPYYRNQLRELFTQYGPITEMWFDGANGGDGYYGGAREKRSIDGSRSYDWPGTLKLVDSLQPGVIFFSDAGPGVRWVGNEKGIAGSTNWNLITTDTLFAGKAGIEGLLNSGSPDGKSWVPAETDVSIRPGWFYHAREDSLVKTGRQLFEIYLTSVGRGSTLLLNVPPDRNGLIHRQDVESLRQFRSMLDKAFAKNLAAGSRIIASNTREKSRQFAAGRLLDNNKDTYWATDDSVTRAWIDITFPRNRKVQYIMLQEYIRLGQRIAAFDVQVQQAGGWQTVAQGTTIGYKRIIQVNPVNTTAVRIRILDSRACPVLSSIGIY